MVGNVVEVLGHKNIIYTLSVFYLICQQGAHRPSNLMMVEVHIRGGGEGNEDGGALPNIQVFK